VILRLEQNLLDEILIVNAPLFLFVIKVKYAIHILSICYVYLGWTNDYTCFGDGFEELTPRDVANIIKVKEFKGLEK
jgi:hypothetical protein